MIYFGFLVILLLYNNLIVIFIVFYDNLSDTIFMYGNKFICSVHAFISAGIYDAVQNRI